MSRGRSDPEGPHWPSLRPTLIDYGSLLAAISFEGELLARSAAGADPELEVPGCPGLTIGSTVRHTADNYHRVLTWIQLGEAPEIWRRAAEDADLIEFHAVARQALVDELSAHEPDEPCATWWPDDQTYGFWRRRMAHETTIHRTDVQSAAGLPVDPVTTELAADGIDEILTLWFGYKLAHLRMAATGGYGAVGILTAGRAWIAILDRARCSARRVPLVDARSADATITGDPLSVYRWLWGRLPHDAVTLDGNDDGWAQLWSLLRLVTKNDTTGG
jgi:uncharacterized protein (TIGR03083 family)